MAIRRMKSVGDFSFSVGLNVVLVGSKSMTEAEQEEAMPVDAVRVLIVDAVDETCVLVDEVCGARQFKTGSVGYSLHTKAKF